jgi:hypothetical protein
MARATSTSPSKGRSFLRHSRRSRVGVIVLASLLVVGASAGAALSFAGDTKGGSTITSPNGAASATWSVPTNEVDAPVVLTPGGAAGTSGNFNAVTCPSTTQCVAVGGDDTLQGIAGTTSSAGASWSSSSVEAGLPDLIGVSCATTTTCVAVGQGAAATSSDSGVTWSAHAIPTTNTTLLGVSCASTTTCVSVGVSPGDNGPYQGQLLVTSNGGTTWNTPSLPASLGALGSVDCPTTSFCVAVGASILVTTNGGSTWLARPVAGGTGVLRAVSCASATTCVAIGPNPTVAQDPSAPAFAVATTNGGTTWNPVVMPAGSGELFSLACSSNSHCEAAGASSGPEALVLSSATGGQSWSVDSSLSPPLSSVSTLNCSTPSGCVFIGKSGRNPVAVSSANGVASVGDPVSALVRRQKVSP